MKTRLVNLACLLALLVSLESRAQTPDITGVWTGLLYVDSTKQYLPYEMIFSEEKGKIKGFSRIVFDNQGKKEVGIRDIFAYFQKGKIIVEDEDFIESDFSVYIPKRIKKTMVMDLVEKDTVMILSGTWSTNKTRVFLSATGTGSFTKKKNFTESALFRRLDTLKKTTNLSFTKPKPVEPVVVAPKVEEVPDLLIPKLESIGAMNPIAWTKVRKPAAIVQPFSKQRRQLFDALAKSVIKYVPPAPPVVVAKPVETKPAPPPPPVAKPVASAPPVVAKKEEKPVVAVPPAPVVEKKLPPAVPVAAPSVLQGAADIEKRAIKIEQALYFDNDSLVLTLYDNGEVDGDTVTVVMNGGIVFSKQGLSTKANTKVVYIPKETDSVKLIMYAESLGEIPPNTGLMVVMDGEKRYDLRFSADLKTSAAIVFRRRVK